MIVFAGVEWNIPPENGNEHVTVLVAPELEKQLTTFKQLFDDLNRSSRDRKTAAEGLRWLAANATSADGIAPVAVYEHPSRRDERSIENVADMKAWRAVNDIVIGFAGAPGHQGNKPIGSYEYKEKPIDRWDPVAARVGDAWDTLLRDGLDVWAAYAPSDFHTENLVTSATTGRGNSPKPGSTRPSGVRPASCARCTRAAFSGITDGSSEKPNCTSARQGWRGRPARGK